MRRLAAVVALALLGSGCASRPEQHVRAVERSEVRSGGRFVLRSELKPGRATLGDVIEWRLTADVPRHALAGRLIEERADSSLAMVDPGRNPHLTSGRQRDIWRWTRQVQGFTLGPIPLPRAALVTDRASGSDTIAFPPDTLFVDSLTAAPRDSIEPDRGPISPGLRPMDRMVAAGAVALLLLLAALVAWGARRALGRRAAVPAGTPPEPPSLRLGRALEALRDELDRLSRDAFYERLSGAVRSYIEDETGIPAPERTTREIQAELRQLGRADAGTLERIGRLLARADLAKFARAEDERALALAAIEEARALVGRLAPPAEPPATGGR
jgi:hypothetical protein